MSQGFTLFDCAALQAISSETLSSFCEQLDQLGVKSGIAQELNGPITTYEKLIAAPEQCVVVKMEGSTLQGYIKFGEKDLFFYAKNGQISQKRTMCVLDFYVDESLQRSGVGKMLFDYMLENMNSMQPCKLAYDRPSPKLLPFLSKHYNLSAPDMQPNRFTIYPGFM